MSKDECESCGGCTDTHSHAQYKCIPCGCDDEDLDEDIEDSIDDSRRDFNPPRSPYGPYSPYGTAIPGVSYGSCYPTPQFKSPPDLTQELLKALLASHQAHLDMLQKTQQRELEMLVMMHERSRAEQREREKKSS
jgi:hypothetical protein